MTKYFSALAGDMLYDDDIRLSAGKKNEIIQSRFSNALTLFSIPVYVTIMS